MNEKMKMEGKARAWGVRLQVPSAVIKAVGIEIGDEVEWSIGEKDGDKIAILAKKEEKRKNG